MVQPFAHSLRVRYIECDMQGIVFNAHYYTWMDLAHQELIRDVIGPVEVLHDLGVDYVVAESSARYLAPAKFDEVVSIQVDVESVTPRSMTTVYTIRRSAQTLVAGRVRHVCVDRDSLAATPWPPVVRTAFEPLLAG